MGQMTSHGHIHHSSTAAGEQRGPLVIVLGITLSILVAEVVGGVLAHSLVLIADAGHMAADAAGVGLSLLGVWFAARPPSDARTFGYQRAEILAAVANAVVLFGVGAFILVEAVRRLMHPETARPLLMIVFAGIALAGNAGSLAILRRGEDKSLNVRGAFLEVLADLLGAVAVIVAAVVIAATGFERADAIASILIGSLILPRTLKLLREALDVLLEATPKDVDLGEVRGHMCETPGVLDVHDLHAWTVTSGVPVLSAHVVVADSILADGGGARLLDLLAECLAGHFDVEHCTFQLEPASHLGHEHAFHR
ncbi:MAG: cation diffusion facilitator family transporter [Acidimicrobiales bacterium]